MAKEIVARSLLMALSKSRRFEKKKKDFMRSGIDRYYLTLKLCT